MKKRYIILIIVAVLLILLIVGLVFLFTNLSTFGIPVGSYRRCDVNGNFIENQHIDLHWRIRKDGIAKYKYTDHKIRNTDSTIYFDYNYPSTDSEKYSAHYKVEYNKTTKILTVYMPPSEVGFNGEEITAFYFRIYFDAEGK